MSTQLGIGTKRLAVVLSLAAACSLQASSAQELTFVGNQGGPFGLCQGDW